KHKQHSELLEWFGGEFDPEKVTTGKELRKLHGHQGWIKYVVFSPDSKLLASGGWQNDKSLRVWEVTTGKQLWRLGNLSDRVYGVVFSPDGKTLFAGRRSIEA